jgi:molecular chaperone DnaJ
MDDPYEVLGLPADATLNEVKAAYHKLAMQYHPDRNPGDEAAAAKMRGQPGL